ncbi:MAG: hypothetical protein PHT19_13070, partial [Methylococcus sp.]|nr:hypothetical protein [Methylococcus sp.]
MKRLLFVTLLCIPAAAWAFFKPVRVVAPELAGLACISDTICTDDVARSQETAGLYNEALRFVDASVGRIEDEP